MEPEHEYEHEYDELHALMSKHNLLSLFERLTFRQKVVKVTVGLRADKESGDYKYAKLQVQRLSAPVSAILVPIIGIGLLSLLAELTPQRDGPVEVEVVKEIEPVALDDIEELDDEPIEPPEPIEMDDFTPDDLMTEVTEMLDAPTTEVSPQPAEMDAVALVKSPVIMRGIVGNRSPGMRGQARRTYGGSGITEGAVMRALRWLKSKQKSDGSWPKTKPAMTGLALLTFLAHGETPTSEKFGETVEKAIRWLVDNQEGDGRFKGRDGHNYSHPIATYALCEAYALTKVPMIKYAAEKALVIIINGQHLSGGWDYNCKESERDDTSYMGWCVQALKAAHMGGLEHPGLKDAMKLAVKGMQKNAAPNGAFGYTSPGGHGGLTGVGVLCMQLMGAANEGEVTRGLQFLYENATFKWDDPWLGSPVYYWYYVTQAKFHAGGNAWTQWNPLFSRELVRSQTVLKGAAADGKDMGYWDSPAKSEHSDGRVMDTCLCTLQLEVYYRYLPTFKTPEVIEEEEELVSEMDEIEVEISI
jgi:hypothetical protein